ncbi:MAG: ferritin-like domain-containing protein, partial [Myxococcales bacterium]|nr:ferritin-like domain-containing protein [Myxococcales bacterium]
ALPTFGALAVGLFGCGEELANSGGNGGAGAGSAGAPSTEGGGGNGNCHTNEIGTCCSTQVCLTHAEVDALIVPVGGAAAGGAGAGGAAPAGGAGGGVDPLACPTGDQLVDDFCFWYNGAPPPGEMCCYSYSEGDCCGRPFLVDGRARVATLVESDAWCGNGASRDVETRVAEAWLADARLEHASIAAFARFTLQLLELGAPPDLVAGSQQAGLDELEHARLCFSLASRLGGVPVGPGSLDLRAALGPATLAEVAVLVTKEGCVGETVAAALATTQLTMAKDPEAIAALTRIAADEAEHAELAWRFVAWAIGRGGVEVARAVELALATELATPAAPPAIDDDVDVAVLHHYGRLTRDEGRAARTRALREIVAPCAARLLGARHEAAVGAEART